MFKKLLFSLFLVSTLGVAQEPNGEFCEEEEAYSEPVAYQKQHFPRYYCRYSPYWNRDVDARWPSKIEDSFYDSLRKGH